MITIFTAGHPANPAASCNHMMMMHEKSSISNASHKMPTNWEPISELRGVTFHTDHRSHTVIWHQTQVNAPRLTPTSQAGAQQLRWSRSTL